MYGSEMWDLKRKEKAKLERTKTRMLRRIMEILLLERLKMKKKEKGRFSKDYRGDNRVMIGMVQTCVEDGWQGERKEGLGGTVSGRRSRGSQR
mgnify:CR=1 FL=1